MPALTRKATLIAAVVFTIAFPTPSVRSDSPTPLADDAATYGKRDTANLVASKALKGAVNKDVVGLTFDYNHVIVDGQSLSVGADSHIAITTTPTAGTVMVGNSVTYNLDNPTVFSPLVAGPGDEQPVVGAVNYFRYLANNFPPNSSKTIVGSSVGVSGRTVEALSKGAPKPYYPRLVGAVTAAKKAAADLGKTYGVTALCWVQGESNYPPTPDAVSTKGEYKAKLLKLREDFIADAVTGTAAQKQIPAFVTYQTGGSYSNDVNGLAIGMAQWELTQETPGCYLATPAYPFVDYGGHLTANGYRWMGAAFGKVLNKVIVERHLWQPLAPRSVAQKDRTISIDFFVPEPPLVFESPYIGRKKYPLFGDRGFTVLDDQGVVPIIGARIVLSTIVELTVGRDTVGEVTVRYADKARHDGNGDLRDSDPTLSKDVYVYDEANGIQRPDEKLDELIGKPYPLYNWCIAFSLPAKK
ncbi:MAG TPA: hypothetical protein VGK19_13500 [Capsulimonadaceae bacterium]|jgi:hypothetical protein